MSEHNQKLILIADDSPTIVHFVRTIVESEGFVSVTASNGKEAYKVLSSGKTLGGVIIDVKMPYIEGTELVKFMHSHTNLAKIPVVVMTGQAIPQLIGQTRSAGAVGFLPKPFTDSQLKAMLALFRRQG